VLELALRADEIEQSAGKHVHGAGLVPFVVTLIFNVPRNNALAAVAALAATVFLSLVLAR
jgi:uncharacterized membrane protein